MAAPPGAPEMTRTTILTLALLVAGSAYGETREEPNCIPCPSSARTCIGVMEVAGQRSCNICDVPPGRYSYVKCVCGKVVEMRRCFDLTS